jgi:hypothetical protein
MERRVQGGGIEDEAAVGRGLDPLGDLVPVARTIFEHRQDQQRRAALLHVGRKHRILTYCIFIY